MVNYGPTEVLMVPQRSRPAASARGGRATWTSLWLSGGEVGVLHGAEAVDGGEDGGGPQGEAVVVGQRTQEFPLCRVTVQT